MIVNPARRQTPSLQGFNMATAKVRDTFRQRRFWLQGHDNPSRRTGSIGCGYFLKTMADAWWKRRAVAFHTVAHRVQPINSDSLARKDDYIRLSEKVPSNPCFSARVEDNDEFVNGAGKHIDMRS